MIRKIAEWLDQIGRPVGRDYNMITALQWGRELSKLPMLPTDWDVNRCALLVLKIEQSWPRGYHSEFSTKDLEEKFNALYDSSKVTDPVSIQETVGFSLRLWAGCISGAKVIAEGTRSGSNSKVSRRVGGDRIETLCRTDLIYRAGVLCSPWFKHLRGEPFHLDGLDKEEHTLYFAVKRFFDEHSIEDYFP